MQQQAAREDRLGPVRHRSAKAQIHLTVIRARTALVSTRTALVNAARRVDEIIWRAAAELRHRANESRTALVSALPLGPQGLARERSDRQ